MTLNEQQLQQLFQNHSKKNHTKVTATDVLNATEASTNRLKQAEQMLDEYQTAQGFKLVFALKAWSQTIANSIPKATRQKSVWDIVQKFKLSFVTAAIALAITLPITLQTTTSPTTHTSTVSSYVEDHIATSAFEQNDDLLYNQSFEPTTPVGNNSEDLVFKSKFG